MAAFRRLGARLAVGAATIAGSHSLVAVCEEADNGPKPAETVKSANELLFAHLLARRKVLLSGSIDDKSASAVVTQLLYLEAMDPDAPIELIINSGGGKVHSAMSVIDTMAYISPPVHTMCLGQAASAAAVIFSAGEPDHRCISPNSRVMIHQPTNSYSSAKFTAGQLRIAGEELTRIRVKLATLLSQNSGMPIEVVDKALDQDTYMAPEDAIAFGLADRICAPPPRKTKKPAKLAAKPTLERSETAKSTLDAPGDTGGSGNASS